MDLLSLSTGVMLVEFLNVLIAKYFFFGSAIKEWYNKFQIVAVLSDYSSIILGILLGKFFFPKLPMLYSAILVQVLHDILFTLFVVNPMPVGHNAIIDLMKNYAKQSGYGIIMYDSLLMGSSVLLGQYLTSVSRDKVILLLLIGVYALTYAIYTKSN